jgi:hypothetical protein
MADTAAKLLIKAGDRVLVLHGPVDARALLGPLPDGATLRTSGAGERADVVAAFATDDGAFERAIPTLQQHARTARAVWIVYPKLTSKLAGTLSRDGIRTRFDSTDITTVTQIAVDATWSALRLRPVDKVGR